MVTAASNKAMIMSAVIMVRRSRRVRALLRFLSALLLRRLAIPVLPRPYNSLSMPFQVYCVPCEAKLEYTCPAAAFFRLFVEKIRMNINLVLTLGSEFA